MAIFIVERPEPLTVTPPRAARASGAAAEETWTFYDFVMHVVDNVPAFGKGVQAVRRAGAIVDALKGSTGGPMLLAEEDRRFFLDAVEEVLPFAPWASRQLLPFLDAFRDAKERKGE